VLLLFKRIRNPIWTSWPLICWQIYSNLATNVLYEVPTKWCYSLSWSEIQNGRPGLRLADTFWTSSQERMKASTPTCHNCSLWGPDQVLLLFKRIRNPIWPPWPLNGWHIFNFSRMAEGIFSKLATNVPYEILTMCCYHLSRSKSNVTALASDWLTYKKLIISFCFNFLSGIYK